MSQADKDKIVKDGQEYIFDFENTNAKLREADDHSLKKEQRSHKENSTPQKESYAVDFTLKNFQMTSGSSPGGGPKSEDSDAIEDVLDDGVEDVIEDTGYEHATEGTGYEVTGLDEGEESTKSIIMQELRDQHSAGDLSDLPDPETKRRLNHHINQGAVSRFTTAETAETQDQDSANTTAMSDTDN